MGLKSSTSRGFKRRRDVETGPDDSSTEATHAVLPPGQAGRSKGSATNDANANANASSASPAASTPQASPALSHQPRPSSTGTPSSIPPSSLPWPMPTVAANTPSPVITASTTSAAEAHRSPSYYRPRPSVDTAAVRPSSRSGQFVFHANGSGRQASGT
jgi:hypothetical protein